MSDVALPYPVLGRADDYIGVDFQATIKVEDIQSIDEENLKLPFLFDLSDEAILALIENGSAKYGFEISCSGTSIRYVEFVEEAGQLKLDPRQFFGKINLSPRVFVVEDVKDFSSPNFNPEFGDKKYTLEPGDFVAAADDDSINVSFEYLSFESAIKVLRQDDLDPWIYEFDLEGQAIIIGMGAKFHEFWSSAISNKNAGAFLIMSVYKDCMVAALEHISAGLASGSCAWERGLGELLDERKITVPESASFSELNSIAQELMKDDGIKKATF